jgi:hypothetical protein
MILNAAEEKVSTMIAAQENTTCYSGRASD